MKLRINIGPIDGRIESKESYALDLTPVDGGLHRYSIVDAETGDDAETSDTEAATGSASALEIMPGVFSVLEGTRSRLITLAEGPNGLEAWLANSRYLLTVADPRDQPSRERHAGASGPIEVRSLMPGKVVRVLVEIGASVSAGQGLVVVEAMKMQNELKAPRDGRVQSIAAREGDTVLAGAALVVLDQAS